MLHAPCVHVDGVEWTRWREIPLLAGARFVEAEAAHVADAGRDPSRVGKPYPIQFLSLSYDRVKLAAYAVDPERGPLVYLEEAERLASAVKQLALTSEWQSAEDPRLCRRDAIDLEVEAGADLEARIEVAAAEALGRRRLSGAPPRRLGAPADASPGQTDLRFHFWAAEVAQARGEGWCTLAEALTACRAGEGDAATEALLLRLARALDWIPTLGTWVPTARARLAEPR